MANYRKRAAAVAIASSSALFIGAAPAAFAQADQPFDEGGGTSQDSGLDAPTPGDSWPSDSPGSAGSSPSATGSQGSIQDANDKAFVDIPQDTRFSFTVDKAKSGGPVVTFLRDASDALSGVLTFDLAQQGLQAFNTLLDLIDRESDMRFEPSELPEFLRVTDNGVIAGDTTDVEPGSYPVKGRLVGGLKSEPVDFTINVTEAGGDGGSDDGGSDDDGSGDDGSGDDGGSGDSADGMYSDVTVKSGETKSVKPEGVGEGEYVFASGAEETWVTVDGRSGEVKLAPGSGVAPGDYDISVKYADAGDLQAILGGDASKFKTTDFTATVESSGNVDDTANQDDGSSDSDESDDTGGSSSGGSSSSGDTSSSDDAAPSDTSDSSGAANVEPVSASDGTDGQDGRTPLNNTADNSTGQQPATATEANAADAQLPVTGVNVTQLAVIAVLSALGAAGLLVASSRKRA